MYVYKACASLLQRIIASLLQRCDNAGMALPEREQQLVTQLTTQAREIGPPLRASTVDRDRLAGWLLAELVALVERLAERCE